MSNTSNTMDFRRLWREMKNLKWIYLAAVVLIGGAAIWYVGRKLPTLPISGSLLVGESSMDEASNGTSMAPRGAGGLSQIMKTFSVGGGAGSSTDNEICILGSHEVMLRTVKLLNLNRSYTGTTRNGGKRSMLYSDVPVEVAAPAEFFDTLSKPFRIYIDINRDGTVNAKATRGLLRRKIGEARNLSLPGSVPTIYGDIQLLKTEHFDDTPYGSVMAVVMSNDLAATDLRNDVKIDMPSKLADVLNVSLDYPDKKLGEAIVNTIMAQYNGRRLERIHETAQNTIDYYYQRIAEALKGLQSAENKAADYQRDNTLVSPASQLPMLSTQNFKQREEAAVARNTLDYYRKVLSTLRNNPDDALIPAVESMGDQNVMAYNEMVTRMRRLRRSAKEGNPAMSKLSEEMSAMRNLIIENADKSIAKAESDLKLMESQAGSAGSQMKRFSSLAKEYTSLERDKEFQNSLYMFLVQARENAVLKLCTDSDVSFVYQPAYVEKPGLPIKKIIIVIAALIFAVVAVTVLSALLLWHKDSITQPIDLASFGLESRTVASNDTSYAPARMRTLLMADPASRIIYCADFAHGDSVLSDIIGSFELASCPISTVTPSTNAEILSPAMQLSLKEAAADGGYVFVKVARPDAIFEIENAIDAPEAKLLAIVPAGMKRRDFKENLTGQSVDKTFVFIA